jgi:hypothetical protein
MREKHPWYRPRRYIHFDPPLSLRKAERVVTDPRRVAQHAFYPFIDYELTTKKIKRDKSTGKLSTTEKHRPIRYAAHLDSHIYSYYGFLLGQRYEKRLAELNIGDVVLAFRSLGKSNIEFADQVFRQIQKRGECSVLALDLSQFFDRIDHQLLKQRWIALLGESKLPDDHFAIYKSLTRYSYVDRDEVFKNLGVSKNNPKKDRMRLCTADEFRLRVRNLELIQINKEKWGIPQGSPISALLSNIYMLDFDAIVAEKLQRIGGAYYRYCDDMLFIVPYGSKKPIFDFAVKEIKNLRLEINEKKTDIRDFHIRKGGLTSEKPLQYLGFMFDGQRKLIRSAALAKYSERMKRGIRIAKLTKIKYNRLRIARGEKPKELFKKKLYERYSHLGQRNFVRYGHRAATIMESSSIKKQLKPLWGRLKDEIKK